MTTNDVLIRIGEEINLHGSQAKAAKKLRVSRAYLRGVVNGEWSPGKPILKALGLRKVVSYEPMKKGKL